MQILNSAFHLETSKKQGMPISASMFYGNTKVPRCNPPCNATATPTVHTVLYKNLTFHLPAAAVDTGSNPKPSFQCKSTVLNLQGNLHFGEEMG